MLNSNIVLLLFLLVFSGYSLLCGLSGKECMNPYVCDKFCINLQKKGGRCDYNPSQNRCVCNCLLSSNGTMMIPFFSNFTELTKYYENEKAKGKISFGGDCGSYNYVDCSKGCFQCNTASICCPIGKTAKCSCDTALGGANCRCS